MESDDREIDCRDDLSRQPLWFRLRWHFLEWRRQRVLRRVYSDPEYARKVWDDMLK